MDDNIDCSPDTTAFSDGYKAGWKARGEYIRDYRDSHSGTSFGLALMMIGGLALACIIVAAIAYAAPIAKFVPTALFIVIPMIAGYFIDKFENKNYAKKQKVFKEKWGD
jgi:hypothetical protein